MHLHLEDGAATPTGEAARLAAVVPREKIIEESRAGSADMQIACRTRWKAGNYCMVHFSP